MEGDEFRRTVWMQMAGMAYEGFLKYGRGGVLIQPHYDIKSVEETPHNTLRIHERVSYIPMTDPQLPEGMDEEFNKYDPETEIVLLLNDGNSLGLWSGKIEGLPSPKTLYQRAHN